MNGAWCIWLLGLLFLLLPLSGLSAPWPGVEDARGNVLQLKTPARRIVSLSPHLTELLFSAGAGGRIVGAVAYSDYPPAARRIPRVGDAFRLDLERILALEPDLVVAWRSGIKTADLERFSALGIPLYVVDSTSLDGIAAELLDLGQLAGTAPSARQAASRYREKFAALTGRYGGREKVTVFYQLWDHPLMTVSGRHVIGEVIRRCGGRNPFAGLTPLAPTVAMEAVLAADPQVMIAAEATGTADVFSLWRGQRALRAVRANRLYTLPGDWISRPSLRILQGMERICAILEEVRQGLGDGKTATTPAR
ncbi:MAG: cobalamin-binding protein [Gammaproteobacteria bacterium]